MVFSASSPPLNSASFFIHRNRKRPSDWQLFSFCSCCFSGQIRLPLIFFGSISLSTPVTNYILKFSIIHFIRIGKSRVILYDLIDLDQVIHVSIFQSPPVHFRTSFLLFVVLVREKTGSVRSRLLPDLILT